MIRPLLLPLIVLSFTLSTFAQEDPTKDPRNRAEHFQPAATLCDDTLQWLMIHRLARTLRDEKQSALGKVQLAYEKSQREFDEKHAKEVDDIVQAFGNTLRMPAKQREPLMRKLLAISDAFPDVAGFQKQILDVLSTDEAAPLIKLLRDRRAVRLTFLDISAGILEETTLPKETQAKILAALEPATKKAYPYRSTAENIHQWVVEQSQIPGVELTKADFAQLDRILMWVQHRNIQVMNEALLSLRVDLPKEDFAKFENDLREQGQWRVRKFEQIVQAPPQPVKPDVPEHLRDPLKDPRKFASMGTVLRDSVEWLDQHKQNRSLPAEKIAKIEALITQYLAFRSEFDEKHRKPYDEAIDTYGIVLNLTSIQRRMMMDKLIGFEKLLPTLSSLHSDVMSLLTYEEGAPLVTLMRTRRQMRTGLFEAGTAITKDDDVSKAAKEKIEAELSRMLANNAARKKVHAQLGIWRREQPWPAGSNEAMLAASQVVTQSSWLLLEMMTEVDLAVVTLQRSLSAEDFAKLEAKAIAIGTPITATLDPKPVPVPLSAIAIPPRDINFWMDAHSTRSTLPRATQDKLKELRKEYEAAEELYEKDHSEAYVKAVIDLEYAGADEKEKQDKIITTLLTFNDKLPAAANYQRAVLAALTPEQAEPLVKSLREQRQKRMALLEHGATITKNLDVPQESKAVIEKELADATLFNRDQRKAFEKLEDWRMKQSPTPLKTIEAMREDSPIARQLNWLMIDMIETVDNAMVTLEDELSEADYAKLEAKAMELGAKLVEPLDPKTKRE